MSKNSNKVNTMVAVDELYRMFTEAVNGKVCKLNYSDAKAQQYAGYDDFSVNLKKTSYNVYMSAANADICVAVDKSLEVMDNPCDTTKKQLRCKLIKFSDTELLKKCIEAVTAHRFAEA